MTYFRVRRTAAEVGTRLRGSHGLVVSGRELAGDVEFLWPRRHGVNPDRSVRCRPASWPANPPRLVRGVDGVSPTSVPPASGPWSGTDIAPIPSVQARRLRPCEGLGGPGPSLCGAWGRKQQGDPHGSVLSSAARTKQRGMAARFRTASCWVSGDFLTFQGLLGA